MKFSDKAQPQISKLPVYQPGKPIHYVAREHALPIDAIFKLASNENPLGPSPRAVEAMQNALADSHYYPDGACTELRNALATKLGIPANHFIFGNGSNDLIELLAHVFIGKNTEAVMGLYSFPVYKIVTELMGGTAVITPMPDMKHDLNAMLSAITERTRIVFLPSTNNPTGTSNSVEEIEDFLKKLPDHVVVLFDEAYAEYTLGGIDMIPHIHKGKAIFCTRTFSKFYGLAGLRIGYGYASAELIDLLNRARQPFNVNSLAQIAALAALDDVKFLKQTREINTMGLTQLYSGFESLHLKFTPSDGNFVLVNVPRAQEAFEFLQKRGIIVRPVPSMGDYLRISVSIEVQNHALLKALEAWLDYLDKTNTKNTTSTAPITTP